MWGETVEVWNTFTGQWTAGFAVIETAEPGVRLRRLSDGAALPGVFSAERVRPGRPSTEDVTHLAGDLQVFPRGDDHGGRRRAG